MDDAYFLWLKTFEVRWAATFLRPGKASLDLHVGVSVLTVARDDRGQWSAHCGGVFGPEPVVGASMTMPDETIARTVGLGLWMALNGATRPSTSAARLAKTPRGRDSLA